MGSTETFSQELERWLRGDGVKTLGSLSELFAEKSFAVMILFLMFPTAMPLPTGGITYLFEFIALVVAAQMVVGRRTIWLPDRWKAREMGPLTTDKAIPVMLRVVRRFERFSRPRGATLFERPATTRVCGLILGGFVTVASLAPPFSGLDTLPSMGAVVVCLAIILGDMVVLGIGVAIGVGGTAIVVTAGAAIVRVVQDLF